MEHIFKSKNFSPDGGSLYDNDGNSYSYDYCFEAIPFSFLFDEKRIILGDKDRAHFSSWEIRQMKNKYGSLDYIDGRIFYCKEDMPYVFSLWFNSNYSQETHDFSMTIVNNTFEAIKKTLKNMNEDNTIFAFGKKVIYFDEPQKEEFSNNGNIEKLQTLRVGSEWTPNGKPMFMPMAQYHAATRIGDGREIKGNIIQEEFNLSDFTVRCFSPDGGYIKDIKDESGIEWEYTYNEDAYPFIYLVDEDEMYIGECGNAHMYDDTIRDVYYANLEKNNFIEGRLFIGNENTPNVISTWSYPVSARNTYELTAGLAEKIMEQIHYWYPIITKENTIFAHWDSIIRLDSQKDTFEPKADFERLNLMGIGSEKNNNLPQGMTKAQYHAMSTIGDNRKINGNKINEMKYKMTYNPDNLLSEEKKENKNVVNKDDVKNNFWKELKKLNKKWQNI